MSPKIGSWILGLCMNEYLCVDCKRTIAKREKAWRPAASSGAYRRLCLGCMDYRQIASGKQPLKIAS